MKLNKIAIGVLIFLLTVLHVSRLNAEEVIFLKSVDTWAGGIIRSTDPAGIVYHPPSGHLFLSDSEINEISSIWSCENIFEISLMGDEVFKTYDAFNPGGKSCPPTSNASNREPSGITYNPLDGYFYVTNDVSGVLFRYDETFGEPLASVSLSGADAEGITCDPNTGRLYLVIDAALEVLVYESNFPRLPKFVRSFSVSDRVNDPEGIAFGPASHHLYLLSDEDEKIYKYTLDGVFVDELDISHFLPAPRTPRGLTFGPSSDPNDDPQNVSLYIVDGQIDNDEDPEERDGIMYEADIPSEDLIVSVETPDLPTVSSRIILFPNFPNPFNPATTIKFEIPPAMGAATSIKLAIFNIRGEAVRTLVQGKLNSGVHEFTWDGLDDQDNPQPSGTYFVRVSADNYAEIQKIVLLK